MKVTLEDTEEFKPVKLTVVIETEEELIDLWFRTGSGPGAKLPKICSSKCSHPLWFALDDIRKQRDIST